MTEKRFTLDLEANVDLPILVDTKSGKWWFIRDTVGNCEILCNLLNEIVDENEQLRMKLKGDDYIMVSEMLSNLRKTGICDGCKNKDKPVEWYLERGFSITGRVCDRYEPEV